MLVSIDHFSGWPDAKFIYCPASKKTVEFLKQYIAQNGVPTKTRADPGIAFVIEVFAQYCR